MDRFPTGSRGHSPRSYTVYDDLAGIKGGHGGHFLGNEDAWQLRDVVALAHVALALFVEGREELAGGRCTFFELGDLVKL